MRRVNNPSPEQRKAHEFLLLRFKTQEPFTKAEFKSATGWHKDSTFDTYWTKQFETLLIPAKGGRFRVSEVFRRFAAWEQFQLHVTQKRQVASDYTSFAFETVMLFDFFMPLTNEGFLRTSLDALFYKDTIMSRLKRVEVEALKTMFLPAKDESEEAYLERLCEWVSDKFRGYSISHVSGRFRASGLKTLQAAYEAMSQESGRYLVDETTAIVRFIFPCGTPKKHRFHSPEYASQPPAEALGSNLNAEAETIRVDSRQNVTEGRGPSGLR